MAPFLMGNRDIMTSNEDRREAKMGSRGEVPCLGFGDEIPIVPMRGAPITRIGAEPLGDNYDSDTLQ